MDPSTEHLPISDAPNPRPGPRVRLFVVLLCLVLVLGCCFVVLQMYLERDNSCNVTPPEYPNLEAVKIEQHPLWLECTMDPGNGDPNYTVRRPWQSVY